MNKLLCCKCGIEIRPNEGYYNAPSGPHCIHCWTGENINDRGKGIYVIKTGAGDYLKKGYPQLSSDYSYELCFVKDLKKQGNSTASLTPVIFGIYLLSWRNAKL